MAVGGQAGRTLRAAAAGLGAALLLLTVADRGALTAPPVGIDPLQILDTQVKPNVLLVLDSSSSMARTLEGTHLVGGDDAASRFAQAKSALAEVLASHEAQLNAGLLAFAPADGDVQLVDRGPLVYVAEGRRDVRDRTSPSNDETPAMVAGFFDGVSRTFDDYDDNVPDEVFRSLGNTGNGFAQPYGCRPNGSKCRFYLQSRLLRNGVKFTFLLDATGRVLKTPLSPFMGTTNCKTPPAALVPAATGPRPCLEIELATVDNRGRTRAVAREQYFLTSGLFGLTNDDDDDDDDSDARTCGTRLLEGVPGCTASNLDALRRRLGTEMVYTPATGVPQGLTPASNTVLSRAASSPVTGVRPAVSGVRLGAANDGTPLQASLAAALAHYAASVFPVRPAELAGRQPNFVVLVTDGRENCAGQAGAVTEARRLWDNTPAANRVQTLVVAFGPRADVAAATQVARAGSGGVLGPDGRYTCAGADPVCRDAFHAPTFADLRTALGDALVGALSQAAANGSYSDQQSITESIFEYVSLVDPAFSPLDPDTRYRATVPVLLQSTFDMPGYRGRLRAFRNVGDTDGDGAEESQELWDAGDKLLQRVTGIDPDTGAVTDPGAMGTASWSFEELHGNATPETVAISPARLKRRILTTNGNGTFPVSVQDNLVGRAAQRFSGGTRDQQPVVLPLWPPYQLGTKLDAAFGLTLPAAPDDEDRFETLRAHYGACAGSNRPAGCTDADPAVRYATATREAREMILAHNAGAEVVRDDEGAPMRFPAGDATTARRQQLQFRARAWVLAESTLSAPAVVAPPTEAEPLEHRTEYTLFRDGVRNAGRSVEAVERGLGLRNPDDDGTPESQQSPYLKPVMSVVYHGANDGLHAFRGGPCPGGVTDCQGETGGEELWAFVPFDQLGKLPERMRPQSRDPHVYMIATGLRFADVWVPGAYGMTLGSALAAGDGVWRVMLYFGRGIGGKHYTALDVTAPGAFTRASLQTQLPSAFWSRGNPDTEDGTATGRVTNTDADAAAWARMGQTWSVPAVGFVLAAQNPTSRRPNGVDFVLMTGSGYGSTATEGTTFFTLDALTGDLVRAYDVETLHPSSSPYVTSNALVASPAIYTPGLLTPGLVGHPASERMQSVFFPDLSGRIFKALPRLATPTVFASIQASGSQPIAHPVALLAWDGDGVTKAHVYAEAGNDNRVPVLATPFRMVGLREEPGGAAATTLFVRDFPAGFRGTAQPATAYDCTGGTAADGTCGGTLAPRVFFAGTRASGDGTGCATTFDSVLFALTGIGGAAAYDLSAGGDDSYVLLSDQRVNAIRVAGGRLVVDTGLRASTPPPPPARPVRAPDDNSFNSEVFVRSVSANTSICRD